MALKFYKKFANPAKNLNQSSVLFQRIVHLPVSVDFEEVLASRFLVISKYFNDETMDMFPCAAVILA